MIACKSSSLAIGRNFADSVSTQSAIINVPKNKQSKVAFQAVE
jgi:hypothetical protein